MKKQLWLMSGPPASGKSQWAKEHYEINRETFCWISRDKIRFSLLQDGEDYFAHEKQTYNLFVKMTQNALNNDDIAIVIADATFLTDKARKKFLNAVKPLDDVEVKLIIMDTSLYTCLERNANREGRQCVPDTEIIEAWEKFERIAGIERINETIVAWGEK